MAHHFMLAGWRDGRLKKHGGKINKVLMTITNKHIKIVFCHDFVYVSHTHTLSRFWNNAFFFLNCPRFVWHLCCMFISLSLTHSLSFSFHLLHTHTFLYPPHPSSPVSLSDCQDLGINISTPHICSLPAGLVFARVPVCSHYQNHKSTASLLLLLA